MDQRTSGGVDVSETGIAPDAADRRGNLFVLALGWSGVVGALVVFADRQIHPGVYESGIVALVLLAAAGLSLIWCRRDQLERAWPWVLPVVIALVALGLWNPWHAAAVSLVLSHPFVATIALAVYAGVLVLGGHRGGDRRLAEPGRFAFGFGMLVLIGASVVASFAIAGFQAPGAYEAYLTSGTDDGYRLDHHEVTDQGRCRAVVLRSGRGLAMRERVVTTSCYPVASVAVSAMAIDVCVIHDYRTATWSRFDPSTLALVEERPATVAPDARSGSACVATGEGVR